MTNLSRPVFEDQQSRPECPTDDSSFDLTFSEEFNEMSACSRHEDVAESNLSRVASKHSRRNQRLGWLNLAWVTLIASTGFARANEAFISDNQPGCLAAAACDGICVTDQIPRPLDEGRG
ncbi:MAG: hypothetical protein WCJ18_12160, partial [Planctomycetota bacterium]